MKGIMCEIITRKRSVHIAKKKLRLSRDKKTCACRSCIEAKTNLWRPCLDVDSGRYMGSYLSPITMVRPPQHRLPTEPKAHNEPSSILPPSSPQSFQLFARIYQVMNSVVPDASGYRRCVNQLLPNIRLTRQVLPPIPGRV